MMPKALLSVGLLLCTLALAAFGGYILSDDGKIVGTPHGMYVLLGLSAVTFMASATCHFVMGSKKE